MQENLRKGIANYGGNKEVLKNAKVYVTYG
jgi:hypothetical protein